MKTVRGIPVSPGVAIADGYILETEHHPIEKRFIKKGQAKSEIERFEKGRP